MFFIYLTIFLSYFNVIHTQLVFPNEEISNPVLSTNRRETSQRFNQTAFRSKPCLKNLECAVFSKCSYYDLKTVEKFSCTINGGPGICCPKEGAFQPSNETCK